MPTRRFPDPVRRRLLGGLCAAGGVLVGHGALFGLFTFAPAAHGAGLRALAVVADLSRCTGCRTCEAVCSAANHRVEVDGRMLPGLGDPHLANMRVHGFLPEVDVPATCALCAEAPCVAACPVPPDEKGRKALYRHPRLHTVVHDPARCIGCRSCAAACARERGGIIRPEPASGHPERLCTLCGGEPQCALHCPYGALALVHGAVEKGLAGRPPEELAHAMMARWYGAEVAP
ncbi:MAG: 4Fe-4S dicluster domain-containing protein [Pseudomonadota bacterium]